MNLRTNRFWNLSREGFDGFRSGLRDAVSGVEQTRSRMMEYDASCLGTFIAEFDWFSNGLFSLYHVGGWTKIRKLQ